MAVLAFENALALHEDSALLFRRPSHGSALALSVLATEEIGKYFLIEDLVWPSGMEPRATSEKQDWLRLTYQHRVKQAQFARQAELSLAKHVLDRIYAGELEGDKQRGLYVGLPRRGKNVDLAARISSPGRVGSGAARAQVTSVSDFLILLAVEGACDVVGLDIPEVQEMLTIRLAKHLRRVWPHMSRAVATRIRSLDASVLAGPVRRHNLEEA